MYRCAISAALKLAFGKQKQRAPFSRIAWISAGRRLIAKSFMNAIQPRRADSAIHVTSATCSSAGTP